MYNAMESEHRLGSCKCKYLYVNVSGNKNAHFRGDQMCVLFSALHFS